MNIEKGSPICSLCQNGLDTLEHIYLQCPVTTKFIALVNSSINIKLDPSFSDPHKLHYITCCHNNKSVNFINAAAKWYISNRFQNKKPLIWDGFAKSVKYFLVGEKSVISDTIHSVLA